MFVSALATAVSAQDFFKNPEKPLSENAGRIAELKELLKIDDFGKDDYFQYPRSIKVAHDGSLFVTDKELSIRWETS